MSRTRVVVLGLALVIIGGWMVLRPHPSAGAAEPGVVPAQCGENTEDVAFNRYCANAPRHWRQAVTRK